MKSFKLFVMTAITIGFAALFLASCDDSPPGFTAVTDITGVPSGWVKDTELTLTGTVVPANATNKTIVWSVESVGSTGASISGGNTLTATAAGTVKVKATITNGTSDSEDYTKSFDIVIADSFVEVTSITGVPTAGMAGTPLTLTGTVTPTEATNKTITWSVKTVGGTGATISGGNTLNTTAAGTVTVTARIVNGKALTGAPAAADYTQDINITISAAPTAGLAFTLITEDNVYLVDYDESFIDTYIVSNGTVTSGAVVIPATHEGKAVTSIAPDGFLDTSITSITIPSSVTYIGSRSLISTTLASVTFQGTIGYFAPIAARGDLGDKYQAGGAGTYITVGPVYDINTWTRQP